MTFAMDPCRVQSELLTFGPQLWPILHFGFPLCFANPPWFSSALSSPESGGTAETGEGRSDQRAGAGAPRGAGGAGGVETGEISSVCCASLCNTSHRMNFLSGFGEALAAGLENVHGSVHSAYKVAAAFPAANNP